MDGSGTYTEYMLINTADDLQAIGNDDLEYAARMGNSYALSQNIDASLASSTINPIGNGSDRFSGNFDGQMFEISKLTIDLPLVSNVGLFGFVNNNVTIENVGLVDVSITGNDDVGALAGYVNAGSIIRNTYSTGEVVGSEDVGGLVGVMASYSVIETSFSIVNVDGVTNVGGLIGLNVGADVTNTYAQGSVDGTTNVGGHTGFTDTGYESAAALYTNAYSTGLVTGGATAGALIGLTEGVGAHYLYSFSNSETSSQGSLFGTGSVLNTITGSSLLTTAAEMKEEATYPSPEWDFATTWQINEGNAFPQLFFETLDQPDEPDESKSCNT